MNVGTKVRFTEETVTVAGNDKDITVPAGTVGKVIKVINSDTLYVQIPGRKVLAWTEEVEAVPTGLTD